jgi:aminopeptidase N
MPRRGVTVSSSPSRVHSAGRVAKQAGGHVTTDEFIALAESISGQQLDELFQIWLFTPEKPATLDTADAQVAAATAQLQQETSPARQLQRVGSKH